ncbi:MAG TPA: hypothetical protein VIM75_20170 [Ohtaekwangia sp.]|uniref:hypothetical protein n=1 Tax=Ohtaekwangia sp. TaxID=2066019 RepID=UPI002F94F261
MARIIFEGWEVGMRKIPFTKLLNEKAGIPLTEAKKLKDRLVNDDEIIEIEIEDEDLAREILEQAQKLNVKGRLECQE